MDKSVEFYYSDGVVLIQNTDNIISFEAFPSNQPKESFENAEFNNVFYADTCRKLDKVLIDVNLPTNMTKEERKELFKVIQKFAFEIK